MNLQDVKDTLSWQSAIDLGPALVRLAEELPQTEQMGLGMQLRALMIELPAAIADDLLRDGDTRHSAVLKVVAALELIDRVYPALDTAGAKTSADTLAVRLDGPEFKERSASAAPRPAAPEPAAPPVIHSVTSLGAVDADGHPIALLSRDHPAQVEPTAPAEAPTPAAPRPATTSVPVAIESPAPASAPAPLPPPPAVQPPASPVPGVTIDPQ